ncbi:MAG: PIG-L family deacetylase [Candidatus Poribacteria bacterium]|nr:PIG-L family deacetylase [Candidatus Poribacteria bacterium]
MLEKENQSLRILVVVAHPHDFTHGAGTCGIHATQGDSVTVVSVTDGANTHNERLHAELIKPEEERDARVISQSTQEYAEQKAEELRQVCALFGVTDVRVLGFPQPFRVEKMPEAVETLRDVIYDVRPHMLITQKPYIDARHGMAYIARDDHSETAIAILEAVNLAGTPNAVTQKRPHRIAATYYLGVYFMPDEIDFYVDISDWKEKRVQAEILFRSQGHTEPFARKRIEIGAGQMGWHAGTGYAEGFVRAAPELLPKITVPESALRRAAESGMDHLKRISGELKAD